MLFVNNAGQKVVLNVLNAPEAQRVIPRRIQICSKSTATNRATVDEEERVK